MSQEHRGAMQVQEEKPPQGWKAEAGLVGLRNSLDRTPPWLEWVVRRIKGDRAEKPRGQEAEDIGFGSHAKIHEGCLK